MLRTGAAWSAVGLVGAAAIAATWLPYAINALLAATLVGIAPAVLVARGSRRVPMVMFLIVSAIAAGASLGLAWASRLERFADVDPSRVAISVVAAWLATFAAVAVTVMLFLLPNTTDAVVQARLQAQLDARLALAQAMAPQAPAAHATAPRPQPWSPPPGTVAAASGYANGVSTRFNEPAWSAEGPTPALRRPWNSMAILSVVMLFIAPIVAPIFAARALGQIKKTSERGKELAVLVLVMFALSAAVIVTVLIRDALA